MKNFVCLIMIIFLTAIQTLMPAAPEDDTHKSVYSVLDFGAKGDGKTDDTDAFQKALDTAAGKDSIGGKVSVDVSSSNTGVIQFQNCAFWGDPPQIANIKGKGAVTFNACNFQFWGYEKKKLPAIECSGGNLIINACNFQRGGEHVRLNEGTASAVITSNRFAGKPRIANNCDGDEQVGFNVQSNLKGKKKNINKKSPLDTGTGRFL